MKKLSKISLKDATILDDKQLKQVFGGSGSSGGAGCSAYCGTVTKIINHVETDINVYASVACSGSCYATDYDGAYCSDSSGSRKCDVALKEA